jgi:hypothetical protein
MSSPPQAPAGSPLAWLLLTNLLFWGGLFGGEALISELAARRQERPRPQAGSGGTARLQLGELLPANPQAQTGPPAPTRRLPGSSAPEPHGSVAAASWPAAAALAEGWSLPLAAAADPAVLSPLAQQLQGADALGGEITLANLNEPKMLPAARAERLSWQRSGNPLSPLPLHWQNRLRLETAGGPPIQRADLVRVPVAQLQQREEVAVLIDEAGTAQSLNVPHQQPVREAVEAWATRQQPADAGGLRAVVIAAEPLPAEIAAKAAPPAAVAIPVPITRESPLAAPPAAEAIQVPITSEVAGEGASGGG